MAEGPLQGPNPSDAAGNYVGRVESGLAVALEGPCALRVL